MATALGASPSGATPAQGGPSLDDDIARLLKLAEEAEAMPPVEPPQMAQRTDSNGADAAAAEEAIARALRPVRTALDRLEEAALFRPHVFLAIIAVAVVTAAFLTTSSLLLAPPRILLRYVPPATGEGDGELQPISATRFDDEPLPLSKGVHPSLDLHALHRGGDGGGGGGGASSDESSSAAASAESAAGLRPEPRPESRPESRLESRPESRLESRLESHWHTAWSRCDPSYPPLAIPPTLP